MQCEGLFKYFLFSLISLGVATADAIPVKSLMCHQLFLEKNENSLNHLALGVRDIYSITRLYYQTYKTAAIQKWAALIQKNQTENKSVWRGMFLSEAGLKDILKNGLDPKKSREYERLYFTEKPDEAFQYSLGTWSRSGGGQKVRVVIEVVAPDVLKPASINYGGVRVGREDHWYSEEKISTEMIKKIYVFDQSKSIEFPFLVLIP